MSETEDEKAPLPQKPMLTIPWWNDRAVGAGDVVAAATKAVGIKPCAPCKRRQKRLNRVLAFGGRKKKA